MLGLTRREARERFDAIIAFAELEDFLDLKLKNYSSGMSVRLAFSVAIQVDADILLIDEVLAVGDAAFQRKCFEEFHRLKAAGRRSSRDTRHGRGRAILRPRDADRARSHVSIGEPHRIARAYNEMNFGRVGRDARGPGRFGDHEPRDHGGVVRDGTASASPRRRRTSALVCALRSALSRPVEGPVFGFQLRTAWATHLRDDDGVARRDRRASRRARRRPCGSRSTTCSRRRSTRLTPSVARAGLGANALDLREDLAGSGRARHARTAAGSWTCHTGSCWSARERRGT